jgi:hypothetical protein
VDRRRSRTPIEAICQRRPGRGGHRVARAAVRREALMQTNDRHDGTELPHREPSAGRLIVRARCWPVQSDSEETQLSLVTGEAVAPVPAGSGTTGAGVGGRARRRPGPVRSRAARAGSRPFPFESAADPAGVPVPAFDEQSAASLACLDPGRSGHRDAYECIAAIFAEQTTAVRPAGA